MPIFNNILAGASGQATGYDIEQSLRFNDDDSAFLSKAYASSGNRKTWTCSCWVKRAETSSGAQPIFSSDFGSTWGVLEFLAGDNLTFNDYTPSGASYQSRRETTALYRDVGAWYHIVVRYDTTDSTAGDRVKLYVNGEQVTDFANSTDPSLNYDGNINYGNGSRLHGIGKQTGSGDFYDGHLAEVHFIDGTALDASSFGETNSATNQWIPIEYVGSYGTNGFYFPFGSEGFLTYDRESEIAVTSSFTWVFTSSGNTDGEDLVNGLLTNDDAGGGWMPSGDVTDRWIKFDFGSGKVYKACQWITINSTSSEGTWKWQGSNNDSDWTDIGGTFTLGGDSRSGTTTYTLGDTLNGNTTSYRYYRILGTTGSANTSGRRLAMYFSETVYGLGGDSSGQGNNFTVTNLSWSDQMLDSPSNLFATFNNVLADKQQGGSVTFREGNLEAETNYVNSDYQRYPIAVSTIAQESGKWYAEFLVLKASGASTVEGGPGVVGIDNLPWLHSASPSIKSSPSGCGYMRRGELRGFGQDTSGYATFDEGDIISVAMDLDNLKCYWAKNNTWITIGGSVGDPTSGSSGTGALSMSAIATSGPYAFAIANDNATDARFVANFGADSSFAGAKTAQGNGGDGEDFYYTPPTGYLALCSDNLSDPSIADPTKHFNTKLYTGTGSELAVTGVGFQPDFTWIKTRALAYNHRVFDVVRGVTKELYPNATNAEVTDDPQTLKSFDSDGFTLGTSSGVNPSSTMASWNWKAGGAASTNEDGSIDSSVSANATAGFSIVSFDGNGTSGATVGHGLSQAPELIIVKGRNLSGSSASAGWVVYSKPVGNTKYLYLNETDAEATDSGRWNDTTPTASVFTLGDDGVVNTGSSPYIAYCFHGVDGYSKVGSYTANGNADGPFIYTGFRPAYTIIKPSSRADNWAISDSVRSTYNGSTNQLRANNNEADFANSASAIDYLSNGFKIRTNDPGLNNSTSDTYIYLAFAESPFKTSNAR
jgi:hypothetical protein